MNFSEIWIKNTVIFIHEKEFANVICNMASIFPAIIVLVDAQTWAKQGYW